MTSLREAVRRWLGPGKGEAANAAEYSYAVHWTKIARTWDAARRERVRAALLALIGRGELVATAHARRLTVLEVDDSPHAGASLTALLGVLDALARSKSDSTEEWR